VLLPLRTQELVPTANQGPFSLPRLCK